MRTRRTKPPDPIRIDNVIGIPLTKGKIAWIDADDYPLVSPFMWYAFEHGNTWYAAARIDGHITTMHKHLMKPPPGFEPDHYRFGNGLWNFRWNLRNVTHAENMKNSRRCVGGKCLRKLLDHEAMDFIDKHAAALQMS